MKDQMSRASLSVCLNLAKGSGKTSIKDRKRFYEIALASHRETQCLIELINDQKLAEKADHLGACLFQLSPES